MAKLKPKNAPNKSRPFLYVSLLALCMASFMIFFGDKSIFSPKPIEEISLSEFLEKYNNNEFTEVEIKETNITGIGSETNFTTPKELMANFKDLGLDNKEVKTKVKIIDETSNKMWKSLMIGIIPFLLLIGLFMFLARRSAGMGDGGPFGIGKSQAKVYDKEKHQTKFSDVAGSEEAKEEVSEIVDFLKNPDKYLKAGAKLPCGVLMAGAPGTGKTLLARAIAGEAEVPFFSVSGSEFEEMFVGVGASRARDLFKTAKRNAPSIIFIDEIDAIGRKRGSNNQNGSHEQTLNQILTEMDGFESDTSVIVIAATNRPDVLDKALLRPGRFDRRVMIDLPDMEAREKILALHSKNKKIAKEVDLRKVASKSVGFSGADLENVLNEAAIFSVKNRSKTISAKDLDNAVEKVSMGPERRSRRINEEERDIIAHHEVGHALAGHFTETRDPVEKVSIISRGSALGVTWFLPKEDSYLNSEQKMFDTMVSAHGGRIAERLVFGQVTTGASGDLQSISQVARAMIMKYGMGSDKIGPVVFSDGQQDGFVFGDRDHSQETARLIDLEVQRLVLESEKKAIEILTKHLDLLKNIAHDLLEKETLTREEFLAYVE